MARDKPSIITSLGWNDLPSDDPKVVQLRQHLAANSGIRGQEILQPKDIERAVELIRRDGFVVIENILNDEQIDFLAAGCNDVIHEVTSLDDSSQGNRGSHRYSFGGSSLTRSQLHRPEWQMLLEIPEVIQLGSAVVGQAAGECMHQQAQKQMEQSKTAPLPHCPASGRYYPTRLCSHARTLPPRSGRNLHVCCLSNVRAVAVTLPRVVSDTAPNVSSVTRKRCPHAAGAASMFAAFSNVQAVSASPPALPRTSLPVTATYRGDTACRFPNKPSRCEAPLTGVGNPLL